MTPRIFPLLKTDQAICSVAHHLNGRSSDGSQNLGKSRSASFRRERDFGGRGTYHRGGAPRQFWPDRNFRSQGRILDSRMRWRHVLSARHQGAQLSSVPAPSSQPRVPRTRSGETSERGDRPGGSYRRHRHASEGSYCPGWRARRCRRIAGRAGETRIQAKASRFEGRTCRTARTR